MPIYARMTAFWRVDNKITTDLFDLIWVSVNVGEDCPLFDGLYEFCQLSSGGSIGMVSTFYFSF